MKRLAALCVLALLLCACGSSQLGESREAVLGEVDVENISSDRSMSFGEEGQYPSFEAFAEDKIVTGGHWKPKLRNWTDEMKLRTSVSYTTVSEREYDEERRKYGPSKATVWYFWDEEENCIAILREPWE